MEFTGIVDYEALRLIASNAPELYEKGYLVLNDPSKGYKQTTDRQGCLTTLYEFYKTFDENGTSIVKYIPKKHLIEGRVWANKPSLQGISRWVRHTICRNTMVDLDIKNAHPTFLIELCDKHDIEHSYLTLYINNRDTILG